MPGYSDLRVAGQLARPCDDGAVCRRHHGRMASGLTESLACRLESNLPRRSNNPSDQAGAPGARAPLVPGHEQSAVRRDGDLRMKRGVSSRHARPRGKRPPIRRRGVKHSHGLAAVLADKGGPDHMRTPGAIDGDRRTIFRAARDLPAVLIDAGRRGKRSGHRHPIARRRYRGIHRRRHVARQ